MLAIASITMFSSMLTFLHWLLAVVHPGFPQNGGPDPDLCETLPYQADVQLHGLFLSGEKFPPESRPGGNEWGDK